VALRVRVCKLAEVVPGQLRAFAVTGVTWPVMVTTMDDQIVAFPGVCPHDDVALDEYGVIDRDEPGDGPHLRCRVHGYRFDLRDGHCEHMPQLHLRLYKITFQDGDLLVDLL
jgi:toluene monooxygenase system ferredoxin subunit